MLAIAAILIFIALPTKAGDPAKFLRFSAAPVLYPPIVLIFISLGAAAVISSLLTK
ncbi:hypothetical protein [Bradyrhizobium sp. 195]|uniref:hypothetical protein n=1 Tax=Bradyrhizobium sp. 195 TaxID=2782662 RepID=UPI002001AEC1|nr:hypothetical protein [Bradyrhizobium sp. 195]UPK31455.1 hypothetical protein IVB26_41470 [Bradyrhizobium sp. 195]